MVAAFKASLQRIVIELAIAYCISVPSRIPEHGDSVISAISSFVLDIQFGTWYIGSS